MGLSLAWHIVLACFGVGLPGLVLFAEWRRRDRYHHLGLIMPLTAGVIICMPKARLDETGLGAFSAVTTVRRRWCSSPPSR